MATAQNDSKAATEALIAKFQVGKLLKQGDSPLSLSFPAIDQFAKIQAITLQTSKAAELLFLEQLMGNKEF